MGAGSGRRRMADIAYVLGLIGFFALCALYVAALDRI
jgi:hypothetical protein